MNSIRLILSIGAIRNMEIHSMDVVAAFLNGIIKETVYMKQPEGYSTLDGKVCEMKKAIYGLKQAGWVW